MKAFTDINQSKKLAEILPIESADMYWLNRHIDLTETKYEVFVIDKSNKYIDFFKSYAVAVDNNEIIPCWSLAALLDILPETIEDEFAEYDLEIDMIYKKPEYVRLCDCHHSDFPSWEWDDTKELLDNIVEAVIWLNNNGYLQYDL